MGKQQLLKAHNRATILNTIRQQGAVSRAEVARVTGLSVGAVTGLTNELIQDGLIYEKQEGDSRGGRPPILLALQPAGAYVVGAKLTEDHITLALTNLDADVIARATVDLSEHEPEAVAERVVEGIDQVLAHSHIQHSGLLGVGIGMAGIVDAEMGICRDSPILGWKNIPFAHLIERRTNFPVYLDNDVNTLTLVEKLYGAGVTAQHFLTVTIGRGVGLGIVMNGQLYRGMGGAGEFGHTVMDVHGHLCACGKRGCLETFVADPWLLKRAAERSIVFSSIEDFMSAAQTGNSVVCDILQGAGQALGRGVAMLVNIFNPQLVIFSGEGVRAGELLLGPMRQALYANSMPALSETVKLHTEPLGDDAWARGAASLVLQELFRTAQPDLERIGSR
jgi:N-acetylglucosamine repressor